MSTSHQPYDSPPTGRHAPRTACAAIPATPTAAAVRNGRRRATHSAPTVAGGVAAGDSAASTVNTTVPATGDRNIIGSDTHAATPTAMSNTTSPVAVPDTTSPHTVHPINAPTTV